MKSFIAALVLILGLVSSSWSLPVDWPQSDIRATIPRDDFFRRNGPYLQLDRKLRSGESGWSQMRISIPEDWKVKEVHVEQAGFAMSLLNGRLVRVSADRIGDLSFRILDGGMKHGKQLQEIWAPYLQKP